MGLLAKGYDPRIKNEIKGGYYISFHCMNCLEVLQQKHCPCFRNKEMTHYLKSMQKQNFRHWKRLVKGARNFYRTDSPMLDYFYVPERVKQILWKDTKKQKFQELLKKITNQPLIKRARKGLEKLFSPSTSFPKLIQGGKGKPGQSTKY